MFLRTKVDVVVAGFQNVDVVVVDVVDVVVAVVDVVVVLLLLVLVLVLVLVVVLAVVVASVIVCLPRRRVVKIRDRVSVRCAAPTYVVTTRNAPSKSGREFHVSLDSSET